MLEAFTEREEKTSKKARNRENTLKVKPHPSEA
jgi:hypothetical protein